MRKGKGEKTRGKEKGKGEEKGKGKGKRRWKEDSLRDVGCTDGHKGDFILCPMLCIALDRQKLTKPGICESSRNSAMSLTICCSRRCFSPCREIPTTKQ